MSTVVSVIMSFVLLAIGAGGLYGYNGLLVVALMAISCWYGWQVGHQRGQQAGMTWYANMLREKGFY